jgi:hypothetical protein
LDAILQFELSAFRERLSNHRSKHEICSHQFENLRVSINGGTPIAGWFVRENSVKMDDLGEPHDVGNLHMFPVQFLNHFHENNCGIVPMGSPLAVATSSATCAAA